MTPASNLSSDFAVRQAPGFYRVRAGRFLVTALCDGHLALPPALFLTLGEERAAELARDAFAAPGPVPTAVNAFVVQDETRTILIDAGMGPSRGPATGRLVGEMQAAGIDPAKISAVWLTHLHGDHSGGLLDTDGQRVFPQAEVAMSESEHRFWSDPGLATRSPEMMQPTIRLVGNVLAAHQGAVTTFAADSEIVPGIRAVWLPGHTPGHTGFIIGTGDDALFIWADIAHVAAFQFAEPELDLLYDVDTKTAAKTRLRVFNDAASDRMRIAGMHLDFPGIGHVARDGKAFRYVPSPWSAL